MTDINQVQTTFDLIIGRKPDLTDRFYEIFFQRHPKAAALFTSTDTVKQGKMLTQSLATSIANLDNPAWFREHLGALGQRHEKLGVTPEMYDWMGECLFATLAEVAGDAWTKDVDRAWRDAFRSISIAMRGAPQA